MSALNEVRFFQRSAARLLRFDWSVSGQIDSKELVVLLSGPRSGAALQGSQGIGYVASLQSHYEAVGVGLHGLHAHGLELQTADEGFQVLTYEPRSCCTADVVF